MNINVTINLSKEVIHLFTNINNKLNTIIMNNTELKQKLDDISATLDSTQSDIDSLGASATGIEADLVALKSQISGNGTIPQEIVDAVDAITSKVTNLKAGLDTASGTLSSIDAETTQ